MPACGSTTAAPSVRTCTRSIRKGAKPTRSSAAWARCTPGTCCRRAWASPTKLTADGRTMLRASYGRFSQGVLTGEFSPFHPGVDPDHDDRVRSGDRRLHAPRLGGRSQESTCSSIPRRARRARTSTPSAWIARSVAGSRWRSPTSARTAATSSDGRTSAVSIARRRGRLPDGRSVPVFVLVNSTADRRFLLTNPDGYSLTYNGLVMVVEKRRSARLAGVWLLYVLEGLRAAGLQRERPPRARRSAPSPARLS